jgi:ABC-type nitrate/sulfonate/bicarbonate transport system permease component
MNRRIPTLARFLFVAGVLILWEAAPRVGLVRPSDLPPLSTILPVLWGLLHQPRFLADLGYTVLEVVIAFLIVAPLALAVGFFLGENERAERVFGPGLNLMIAVPKSVFLPVFILALGIGLTQKVVFFVIVPSAIAAVHSIPKAQVTAARSFGAGRWQMYLHIYAPAMAPVVLGGLRLGVILTVFGVLFAEMYASSMGIGRRIFAWGELGEMPQLFAAVLLIVILTASLNAAMQACENYSRSRFALQSER